MKNQKMKIYLDNKIKAHQEIKQRMLDMSLAFETVEGSNSEFVLVDGRDKYLGESDAEKHLDEVADELHSWYYCNC